ncbi:MAG: type II toxin-antitoxin system HicA family toxin [Anaerovoracaceae bacterium]
MNAREVEKKILADGWYLVKQVGSHKQYKHIKTVATILKQAGLK